MIHIGPICFPSALMQGWIVAWRFSSPLGPTTAIQQGCPVGLRLRDRLTQNGAGT